MRRSPIPLLVLAQLGGTSVWFAGNAIAPELEQLWGSSGEVARLTGAVQLGFIAGTLVLAISGLVDRRSPARIFLVAALVAATLNALVPVFADQPVVVLALRAGVGVMLAGIYPVGMTLAASWAPDGLGRALGWLVGALVVGTAAPHGVRALTGTLPWSAVLLGTSALCAASGVIVAVGVGDGPHRAAPRRFALSDISGLGSSPGWRRATGAYIAHMWELYTFWALVPAIVALQWADAGPVLTRTWSFAVIAAGGVGCAIGGELVPRLGSAFVARLSMIGSGALAVTFPLWASAPRPVFGLLLLLWGVLVVADSPQLSTLTARAAPPSLVGTGITVAVCAGFATTMLSLQVSTWLPLPWVAVLLGGVPLLGSALLRDEPR